MITGRKIPFVKENINMKNALKKIQEKFGALIVKIILIKQLVYSLMGT